MEVIMKKMVALLFLFSFLSFAVSSQNWGLINTPDISGKWTLTAVAFPSPEKGFAVGYDYSDVDFAKAVVKGIILEYNNGKWIKTEVKGSSDNWQLNNVWFLNNNEGWATGMNKEKHVGLLMHYKDGKWDIVELPCPALEKWVLYDVFFLNENEGWAAGGTFGKNGPVLFHYKDGKWNFEIFNEFKTQTIMTIYAKSADNVFAGGFREGDISGIMQINKAYGSFIINNSNGWTKAKLPLLSGNVICEDFANIDDNNIYAVGWMPAFQSTPRTGQMLHYNGKKWEDIKLPDVAKEWTLSSVDFSDANNGWAVGYNWSRNKGILLQFNKGTWSSVDKKTEPQVSENWLLRDVVYDGNGNWYAVGGDYKSDKGVILKLQK